MSQRNELPQSGWNLPPGVSDRDIEEVFGEEDTEVDGGDMEPCAFCRSKQHYSDDCPQADASVNEHLEE